MPSANSRLSNLDLLRLFSALMVLCFHYGFRMAISGEGGDVGFPELAPVAMWGDIGLVVFFTISGYVIALSADNRSAFDFAVGRFARLWPTFVVCATITALVTLVWPVPGIPRPSFMQWAAQLVIVSRALGQPFMDGAYWTIVYEIIFYGWVFALLLCGWFRQGWRVAVLIWITLSALNEFVLGSDAVRKLLITEYSGFFAFGLVLFHAQRCFDKRAACLLVLALGWAIIATLHVEPRMIETYGVHRNLIGVVLVAPLALAAVSFCVLAPALPIKPRLAFGLGALTYPLYLLHQHIGYAVFTRFATGENRWLVALVLVSALAAVAWLIAVTLEPWARRLIINAAQHLKARAGLVRSVSLPLNDRSL